MPVSLPDTSTRITSAASSASSQAASVRLRLVAAMLASGVASALASAPARGADCEAQPAPARQAMRPTQAPPAPADDGRDTAARNAGARDAPVRRGPQLDAREIQIEADSLEGTREGTMRLEGNVVISQGERRVRTKDALYDSRTQSLQVDDGVEYADPDLVVSGAGAHVDPEGATFEDARFELRANAGATLEGAGRVGTGRGSARRIRASAQGKLQLDDVRYTTCPVGNEDWLLRASDIDIDQGSGIGIGRGVRLDFKGVPILYTPFISFPVGNERKSGFLFPTLGSSSRSGYSLSVPWYWNIAPNYDATFTPTWFSKRGAKLDTELRYLTGFGRGALQAEVLPDDQQAGRQRSLVRFADRSELSERLRLDVDAANASDSRWFEDFGLGPEGTSISYLSRAASLTYLDDHWLARLRAQNFQTIDDLGIAPGDRPHTLLPQLAVRGRFPEQPFGLSFGLDLELGNFAHELSSLDRGWRMDVAPEVRMPLRGSGVYLEPAARWRYTAYRLDDAASGRDNTPDRSAPVLSLDGGLVFERLSGSRQQRLHTIEPRFMYLYVPYRNQNDLPVFDTDVADLNLVQLFRDNRYVGADRLGDANQLSIGLTSRLLDSATGEQFIAATIGQAYYFDPPRVSLPGEALEDPESSDIVAELDLTAYQDWNISMGVQWDPGDTRSEKGDLQLQYKPAFDRVVNLGYRFRRGNIEQVDGSLAWPMGRRWSAYARMVYSLEDETTLDQFAGLEYRSCCWRLRVVARRYVKDRTGDLDTSILLQLQLNGLSNVGVGADAFLERSIRGYSFDRPER